MSDSFVTLASRGNSFHPATLSQLVKDEAVSVEITKRGSCHMLPEPQRVELVASLIHSLEPTPDPKADAAWAVEINRRLNSIDEGAVSLLPSEDVLAEMKQRRNG